MRRWRQRRWRIPQPFLPRKSTAGATCRPFSHRAAWICSSCFRHRRSWSARRVRPTMLPQTPGWRRWRQAERMAWRWPGEHGAISAWPNGPMVPAKRSRRGRTRCLGRLKRVARAGWSFHIGLTRRRTGWSGSTWWAVSPPCPAALMSSLRMPPQCRAPRKNRGDPCAFARGSNGVCRRCSAQTYRQAGSKE